MGKLAKTLEKVRDALDMSQKARMERADQMFPAQGYHATRADISEFKDVGRSDLGFHFGTPEQAQARLEGTRGYKHGADYPKRTTSSGENIIPARLNVKNPLRVEDAGYFGGSSTEFILELRSKGIDVKAGMSHNQIIRAIEDAGYDGLVYKNLTEGAADSIVALRPDQIRSVHAAFDPAKKESADILAGVAGATIGAGALFSPEEAAADFTQRRASKQDQWKQLRERMFGASPLDYMSNEPQQTIEAPQSETLLSLARGAQAYNDFVDKPLINLVAPQLPAELWRKQAYGQPTTLGERSWAAVGMLP